MTEVMEPQIWENFPEDLFKDVLTRLPIATISRFRTVCQQWNNLITSQSFSQQCVQVSQANPWFYTDSQHNYHKAMYDPFVERWYYPNKLRIAGFPLSSAGGLVCSVNNHGLDLYVCNPLTQCFKKLPAGSIEISARLGMTVNGIGGYKVLRLGHCYSKYEIYDSVTKNWGHLGKLPEYIMEDYIGLNPVSIDDTLYFMHFSPKGIVSCNTSTGVWTQHLIQMPLHRFDDLALAESGGQMMLVGMLKENNARFVCIWEVQKVTFLLKEVDRRQFSEFQGTQVSLVCLGNKGLLLFYLRSRNMYHMVTYNIATRKWGKVCLPYGRKQQNHFYMCGTAFQPCLTAMP